MARGLTWRRADCGLRLEDWVPEKGGRDRGGARGCLGVENGVEEELPADETRVTFKKLPSHCCQNRTVFLLIHIILYTLYLLSLDLLLHKRSAQRVR